MSSRRIMFSVHVGDSISHVLRTRGIAKYLVEKGHDVIYSVNQKATSALEGYLDKRHIYLNNQDYSYARFPEQPNVSDNYYQHALKESEIFQRSRPDVLIGDTGLLAYCYAPNVPFLRILDRFYVEIDDLRMASAYGVHERAIIVQDVEDLINQTRRRLGISEQFQYHDFVSPPALINGASYFVDDIYRPYTFVGMNMALNPPTVNNPSQKTCFVALGTGLASHRLDIASIILRRLEGRFQKIYVSYGVRIDADQLYRPPNAIMKPIFETLPTDIGAVVCHGGYSSVHLGIFLEVPLIIVPFQIEQFSNAWMAEQLGVGINTGTYDRTGFKGLYENIEIDWDRFEFALDNLGTIRRVVHLSDTRIPKGLHNYVEDFILNIS